MKMNLTNTICTAVLGWILLYPSPQLEKTKEDKSTVVCSIESKEETEVAGVTASSFPRPRKPCPSGPGKK